MFGRGPLNNMDQARGRFGRNSRPNWAQGDVGVFLKTKTKKYFFRTFIKSFHKQAVKAI